MKKLILSVALLGMLGMANAQTVKVSGGAFEMKEETLTFNGKKIITSEDTMSIHSEGTYKIKDSEVVLFSQSTGGNACPGTYFFVNVEKGIAKRSSIFGTCSDLIKVKQSGNTIMVTMPNMGAKGVSKYIYDGNSITENGKALKY